jgi:hypothetical protein
MGVGKGAIKGGAFVAGHAIHGGGAVVGGVVMGSDQSVDSQDVRLD